MAEKAQLNSTAKIAKNSLVQLAAGVLNKVLGVALVIYAARQLGTAGFGEYSFILSLQAIFYIFTDFGLGVLMTRDLARQPDNEPRHFSNVLVMRVLLSLLAAAGMVGSVIWLGHPPALVRLAGIAALSLFFASNIDTCAAFFNAHQRMEVPATFSVVGNTLRVTASLGALAGGAGVMALLWIFTAASAIQFVLLLTVLLRLLKPVWSMEWPLWKELLRAAWPLALANLFSVVYFRIDTVMLASMRGQEAVGVYNAAYRLLEFTLILPAYYCGAIFPVISASFGENFPRFVLIYQRSLKYMLVASLPIALGASLLAPQLMQMLYGPAYAAGVPVLSLLMWTLVLIAVNSINAPYLISMGRQRIVTWLMLVGMLLNTGLNYWAIGRFGILGAAGVTLFSEVVTVILFIGALIRPLGIRLRVFRHFFRPLAAGALMVAALRLVPAWDLGFQIMLGAVVYIGLLFGFRVFDEVDAELFSRMVRPTSTGNVRLT